MDRASPTCAGSRCAGRAARWSSSGIGELENGDEFPPGHLAEHQATAEPVVVYYRVEGNERFAVRLEDAGA